MDHFSSCYFKHPDGSLKQFFPLPGHCGVSQRCGFFSIRYSSEKSWLKLKENCLITRTPRSSWHSFQTGIHITSRNQLRCSQDAVYKKLVCKVWGSNLIMLKIMCLYKVLSTVWRMVFFFKQGLLLSFLLTQSPCVFLLAWNSLCRPSGLYRDLLASASECLD